MQVIYLTRKEAALYLTKLGFPIAVQTLETKVSRGNGPSYIKWGKRVLYNPADLISWAEARLERPRVNSSEQP